MSWIKIDYDNPPKGEVLLLTTSKVILKGDWYENNLVKGFGWRTEWSKWVFLPPDGKEGLTLTPMSDVHYYQPLPSAEINKPLDIETIGKKFFYAGFEKALKSDANCFEAWREEAHKLFNSIK